MQGGVGPTSRQLNHLLAMGATRAPSTARSASAGSIKASSARPVRFEGSTPKNTRTHAARCAAAPADGTGHIPAPAKRNGGLGAGGTAAAADPDNADAWCHQRSSDPTKNRPGEFDRPSHRSPAAWVLNRFGQTLEQLGFPTSIKSVVVYY